MHTQTKTLLAAALALCSFGCAQTGTTTTYETTAISRGSIIQSVSAVGTIASESSITVQSPASGIVDTLHVAPGNRVAKGQKIAEVNTTGNPNDRQLVPVYSPVGGIVYALSVSVGSPILGRGTPASTSLCTINSDDSELLIQAPVGELDITSLKKGQEAKMTLQALPGASYETTVEAILPTSTTTDNVVTYTVVSRIPNEDGRLKPGMTCALTYVVEEQEGVLCVPNAALRYTPAAGTAGTAPTKSTSPASGITNAITGGKANDDGVNPFGHPTGPSMLSMDDSSTRNPEVGGKTERTLWYLDSSGNPAQLAVYTGITDGIKTRVEPVDPSRTIEGLKVITREAEQ